MLLGEKIKVYRKKLKLSQEELAEKLTTSRQTISSWENDKTYPDIQTIIVLSELFKISIESLLKEDVEKMKNMLDSHEREERIKENKDRDVMNRLALVRLIFGFFGALTAYPVYVYYPGNWFYLPILWLICAAITTIPIEMHRKKYNLQKYQDIVAFLDKKYDY